MQHRLIDPGLEVDGPQLFDKGGGHEAGTFFEPFLAIMLGDEIPQKG